MNVFIVGAAKAGTTSLFYYLEQHPNIVTPRVKEPHYFSHINPNEGTVFPNGNGKGDKSAIWIYDKSKYLSLFPNRNKEKSETTCYIDAAVTNLYSETAASEIKKFDPDSKIIILLRNPIDRAWSHYNHLARDGREENDFRDGLELEEERIKKGWEFSWHYKKMGLYDEQVNRYLDHFPEDQILIILFEDFIKNAELVLEQVNCFLGLSNIEYKKVQSHNSSGISRSPKLAYLVDQIAGFKKTINSFIPPTLTHKAIQLFRRFNVKEQDVEMGAKTRQYLREYYSKSIRRTGELINRDLSHWA